MNLRARSRSEHASGSMRVSIRAEKCAVRRERKRGATVTAEEKGWKSEAKKQAPHSSYAACVAPQCLCVAP